MKTIANARFRNFSVEMGREDIAMDTFSPSKVPDEKWKYVDKKGHGHFWVLHSKKASELPTLEWVVTGTQWIGDEHDGDSYDVGEYRCRQCGEVVKPGMRLEYANPIPGPMTVTVTIGSEAFSLSESEYQESLAGWEKALQEIRDRR